MPAPSNAANRVPLLPPPRAVRGILRADGLRIVRDRFLVGTTVYVFAIAVAMRWLIPFATDELADRIQFDLSPYHALIVSHVLIQLTPLIGGLVGGFLLLESRESRVVDALRVTPVTVTSHVLVLASVLVAATVALVLVEALLIGIALPSLPALAATSAAAAPAAVAFALLIPALASSKTEAFAYAKVIGVLPLLASAAWFLPGAWQYTAGVYPPYWASKAYWVACEGGSSWPLCVLMAVLTFAIWLAWIARWYARRTSTG